MEKKADDIDPELLKHSGRASAIQDLAKQAKEMSDRAAALEDTTVDQMTKQNRVLWRAVKGLIFAVALLVAMQGWQTYRSLYVSGPKLDNIDSTVSGPLSDANGKLDFILDYIKQSEESNGGQVFLQILCSSDDELRQQKCDELREEGILQDG